MSISINVKIHRVVSLSIKPDFDPTTGVFRWLDLVMVDDDGNKDEIVLFAPGDDDLAIDLQGTPLELDNPRRRLLEAEKQPHTHPEMFPTPAAALVQSFELPANDFTEKENLVLKALMLSLYAEPGFSDVEAQELATQTGLTVYAVGGVLSSLLEKGVISTDDSHGLDDLGALIYLQESHYWLHPIWGEGCEAPIMATDPDAFLCNECGITDRTEVALCLADECKHGA